MNLQNDKEINKTGITFRDYLKPRFWLGLLIRVVIGIAICILILELLGDNGWSDILVKVTIGLTAASLAFIKK